jgi:ATP-dependent RNA helicase DDX60
VQMLAQKGRLAVVFSDDALAYGVNMPFRSCIFCGDMGDRLTPLIAQQMQGRAGRRGLDVQGNVIYLGMDWTYIENLMLGQISNVTGKEPRYATMVLQHALAASNDPDDIKRFYHDESSAFAAALRKMQRNQRCFPTVTEQQIKWMCGQTLEEFCEGKSMGDYFGLSKKVVQELGYVHEDLNLAMHHNVVSMVWEMHQFLPEGVYLVPVLEQMFLRFCYNKTKSFKESDATQNEFLSILLHVVDRTPAKEGDESLQQHLRIAAAEDGRALSEDARSMWLETEKTLKDQTELIQSLYIDENEKKKLLLVLPAAAADGDIGPALDKGVYEMLVSKQKGFSEEQSIERRNELNHRVLRLARICQIVHNNIQQPHGKFSALEVLFRR